MSRCQHLYLQPRDRPSDRRRRRRAATLRRWAARKGYLKGCLGVSTSTCTLGSQIVVVGKSREGFRNHLLDCKPSVDSKRTHGAWRKQFEEPMQVHSPARSRESTQTISRDAQNMPGFAILLWVYMRVCVRERVWVGVPWGEGGDGIRTRSVMTTCWSTRQPWGIRPHTSIHGK